MPQCKKIKKNNEKCQAHALINNEFCLFHSENKEVRKVKPLTKEKMIQILRRQIKKLEKEVDDPVLRSGEIRRNLQLIMELKGEKPSPQEEGEESDSLSKKLEAWRKEEELKKKQME